ncbi:hypothetical protein EVAR_51109_1 [Eumeta japonica]|uniref:Uncharacterized protein n=1 Tax=Eumeta variegata TaxID=151549 RepID=A0A4C1YBF2_EUMVA|nr:hypothetical protein EVAR_51109_1 [Eumeta japonica]
MVEPHHKHQQQAQQTSMQSRRSYVSPGPRNRGSFVTIEIEFVESGPSLWRHYLRSRGAGAEYKCTRIEWSRLGRYVSAGARRAGRGGGGKTAPRA